MSNFWGLFLFEKICLNNKLNFSFYFIFFVMKKYLSLIGITLLILAVGWLWYQALFAYLSEHTYYFWILSSGENWWVFVSALVCAISFPIMYLFLTSKLKIRNLIMRFVIWAWIFGLVHSHIKWSPVWFWNIITIFNTILLVSLGIYLMFWFLAIWSRIERKIIKFNQFRWQEIFLSFWIWFCSFVTVVQLLMWIWLLYWIVSWALFLWLGFMIRYERKQLWKYWEIISGILCNYKDWIISWEWNLNSKEFWNWKKIWLLVLSLPILLSLAYLYIWIQNSFVPYSTAWDANHEYMYIPKILAENAGIYRWNTVGAGMPWFWHQFLTFIFSLTGCTNWRFGLSSDNIAISMNNMSAFLVLIFWIAIIFQIFTFVDNKRENSKEKSELKKWKNDTIKCEIENTNWISMWWYMLLLWLTSWMWAFLVIVDNKTDLWVMAISLLALLAWLIFLQNKKDSKEKNDLLKYILIAGLFFWIAALAKITAFVDLVLFGLVLIWLWFSSIISLWLWLIIMWLVRKFAILTSFLMISNTSATWMIIIWLIITVIGIVLHFLKRSNRKAFRENFKFLLLLWIWFIAPVILLKLPRTTISLVKDNNFSISNSLKAVFLSINTDNKKDNSHKFLAQNEEILEINSWNQTSDTNMSTSIDQQDEIDNIALGSKKYWNYEECISAWDIYSYEELDENMQESIKKSEDLWRYIWYWWKEFKKTDVFSIDQETANKKWFKFFKAFWPKSTECGDSSESDNVICESNLTFWLMKLLWPTSDTCYSFNHDAKVLCNNADKINDFKIDDLRAIYENWINNQDWEASKLLKAAIDAYDKAEFEWKIWSSSNTDLFHEEIVKLRQYYQSHNILSTEESINIPYRYLVPLNISFNWSLQNLSSYYTDIWFFLIIIYLFLLIALPYAIIKKDKTLTSIALSTLIWRWIRWIIWAAILWYWTVLISRSIITIAIFWDKLLKKDNDGNLKIIPWILIIFVGIIFWIQIIFNYLRIASQWANSVFVWYKWNVGNEQNIDDNLQQINKVKYWYTRKNIFNLQFPQYNPIIHYLSGRDSNDWVTVAGTYIQYFLWNQRNVRSDWMLSDFWDKTYWTKSSNLDLCKTYRRLKNENTRYLIIDPNIWTVTMGEWNESLFYRFFAKLNWDKSKIISDGAITTFIRLYELGYLKLVSTNNIWSKYAFTLDDNTIRRYFWENLTDEELILTRWKLAVLQYFDDANSIFSSIAEIFISRIMNNTKAWVEDIANIYWFEINSDNVANAAKKYIEWKANEWIAKDLTQNERTVLITYINLYLWYKQWWESAISSNIQNLLLSSVTWWSQIFALELN